MKPLNLCDLHMDCKNPVTHIGNKGYLYCSMHAVERRQSGYERTRKMVAWELKVIANGEPLPSYTRKRKPDARWIKCVRAADRLADMVCLMYHPGDTKARLTWPTATWAEIIASELGVDYEK